MNKSARNYKGNISTIFLLFFPLINTQGDEKGKMKKEKGEREKAAGASIHPDESGPLGNRLLPTGPQTATRKSPPLRLLHGVGGLKLYI